jgi:Aspartyl protease
MSDFAKLPSPCTFRADHYREYSRSSIGAVPVPDVLLYLKPVGEEDFTRFPVMFIVDSGADVTILPKWNARDLEISLDGVEPKRGRGAGAPYEYYADPRWEAEAWLCGEWTKIPVRFFASDNAHDALLGRKGAFDALELVFVQGRRVMYARRA